jgi:IS30 family transposase
MISKQHLSALVVLVERKSRLTKVKKLQRKTAQKNKNGIVHH